MDVLERLQLDWRTRIAHALAESGARAPRRTSAAVRIPFEELASAAVEEIWSDVERLVRPALDLAGQLDGARTEEVGRAPIGRPASTTSVLESRPNPWMDADEAASMLQLTPHTLRRLAQDGRCPVLVRRIGGRWRFARSDVVRFVSGEPSTVGSREPFTRG